MKSILLLVGLSLKLTGAIYVYNPYYTNFAYEDGEVYATDTCISVVNSDNPDQDTAVAYQCISSSQLRKHYWDDNGISNCRDGSSSDSYDDYYSYYSYSDFAFSCSGGDSYAIMFYNYSYSQSSGHSCSLNFASTYLARTTVTDVCAPTPSGTTYYSWSCDSSNLVYTEYTSVYCYTSTMLRSVYYSNNCNISLYCDYWTTYDTLGYNSTGSGHSSSSSSTSAIIGSIVGGIIWLLICIALCRCCRRYKERHHHHHIQPAPAMISQRDPLITKTTQSTVVNVNVGQNPQYTPGPNYANFPNAQQPQPYQQYVTPQTTNYMPPPSNQPYYNSNYTSSNTTPSAPMYNPNAPPMAYATAPELDSNQPEGR